MVLAGVKVVDTSLVRDAIDLARSSSEPYLFNHVMRSWLFAVLLSEETKSALDPEVLAVSTILHDLGMTDRYTGAERFEVDSAYRLAYNTLHSSPQGARSRDDAFRNRCRRNRGRTRSNPAGEDGCDSHRVSTVGNEEAIPGLPVQHRPPEAGDLFR